jgi:hypothetical protein
MLGLAEILCYGIVNDLDKATPIGFNATIDNYGIGLLEICLIV